MDYFDGDFSVDFLEGLAIDAGKIICRSFGKGKISWKEDKTPVTKTDKLINKLVIDRISGNFPDISIISEEGSHVVEDSKYTVFCDPVDGTFPYIFGIPVVSFCIAVVAGDKMPIAGVIYDPFLKRMWWAEKGQGAFLNNKRIKVSRRRHLAGSNAGIVYWKGAEYNLHEVCFKLIDDGVNWFNPVSIAYLGGLLAMGNIDATIFPGKKPWEAAAMQVIVEEAGGKATDIFGNELVYPPDGETKGHIMSNGLLHEELVDLVRSCQ